ncbi:MAG: MATE family efflux transporter [Saccharofermentans sp.]|nr:MATE family efflux transporter [Saccharofermentans sp.]
MAKTTDMTKGNPLTLIAKFAIPLFLGNIFQQLYNMADSAIVGQKLGVDALTAVGQSASITFLIFGFAIGTCAGFGIPVSQRFGAGDYKSMRKFVLNSFYLAAVLALILTVVTSIYTTSILRLIHTPDKYLKDAADYLLIIFLGLPMTVLYNQSASMERALGDSKTPFIYLVVSAVLNVALDFLFIFSFNMGVRGAAVATVIAQGISGILCTISLFRNFRELRLEKGDAKPEAKSCMKLVGFGIPMGLQCSVTAIGSIMLQTAVNGLDYVYISAYTVALKLKQLFIPEFDSLGTALATFVGQNYGAGKFDRIKQGMAKSLIIAGIFYIVTLAANVLGGEYLIMVFVKANETAVIAAAYKYIVIDATMTFLLAMLFIFRYTLQGIGRSFVAMIAGVWEMVSRLAMSLWVIPLIGWNAACVTDPIAWGSAMAYCGICCFFILRSEKKKHLLSSQTGSAL